MSFEEYMNSKIPTWNTDLTISEIEKLENLFEQKNDWQKTVNITLEKQLNNKSNIDYVNDYEKARKHLANCHINLEKEIYKIKQRLNLGINEEVFEQSNKTI